MKFKATHKKTGEQIEFGLEDIRPENFYIKIFTNWLRFPATFISLRKFEGLNGISRDYTLQYLHQGEWFDYEEENKNVK